MEFSDYVFDPGMEKPDQFTLETMGPFKAKVLEWTQTQGVFDMDDGIEQHVTRVNELLKMKMGAETDLQVLQNTYEDKCTQIAKTKKDMMTRLKDEDPTTSSKIKALESWCKGKLEDAAKPCSDMKVKLKEIDGELDAVVLTLLQFYGVSMRDQEMDDPEQAALMRELEAEFEKLDLSPKKVSEGNQVMAPGDMANTAALNAIASLPDGPQKTALFAVLEASAVTPRPDAEAGVLYIKPWY